MKGVILDSGSLGSNVDLNPILDKLSECEIWTSTAAHEIPDRIKGMDIILTNKIQLDEDHFRNNSSISLISILATGTNNVDLQAARRHGINVSNVIGYSTESVAQHAFAMILALSNNLISYREDLKKNRWQESPFFCYFNKPILSLAGKTLGLVGSGFQGKKMATIAKGFGMKVIFCQRPGSNTSPDSERPPLKEMLPEVDFLSIHCPLTEDTSNLISANELSLMKKGSILVNCARGGIVNEIDLIKALETGQLSGVGIDVLTQEPPPLDHPLFKSNHPNLIVTPHIAWGNQASRQKLIEETGLNIAAHLGKGQRNLVN
ncbi:MAG: glycerate dehydrogenase [Zetaproteobacteria bacterium]|nr:glycerate dehydrogenase [Pseudobdellovibrionaceae bacterium]|tara:strand:+ start:1196 stop:2152 length:957 start_codon:yes stop_codon:yes gene_type:complete